MRVIIEELKGLFQSVLPDLLIEQILLEATLSRITERFVAGKD
jgi:hypothetical protein